MFSQADGAGNEGAGADARRSFWTEYLTMAPPSPHRDRKKSLKNPRNVPVDACPRDEDLAQAQVRRLSTVVTRRPP